MEEIILDRDDFDRSRWQDIISTCDKKECSEYSTKFFTQAKEVESKGNLINKNISDFMVHYPSIFDESN